MAYISFNKLCENEFDIIVSKKDKARDININQLKLEVQDTYETDEKITTNVEPINDEDFINKACLHENLLKIDGHISLLEKDYNEYKILSNKQFKEEVLIRRAVKTTIQKLYDKCLFDSYGNANEVLKDFLFNTRCRPDLEKVNDDVIR